MIWREALGDRELSPILHGKRSFFGESPSCVIRFRRLASSKRASWACHHAVEPSSCSISKDSQVVQLSFGRQSSREMNQRRWSRERNSRSSNPIPSIGHRHLSGPGLDEMRRHMSCDNSPLKHCRCHPGSGRTTARSALGWSHSHDPDLGGAGLGMVEGRIDVNPLVGQVS